MRYATSEDSDQPGSQVKKTIAGILTFISRINITSDSFKASKIRYFSTFLVLLTSLLNSNEHDIYPAYKC